MVLQLQLPLLRISLRPLPQNLPLHLPCRTLRHLTEHYTLSQLLVLRNLSLHPLWNHLRLHTRIR